MNNIVSLKALLCLTFIFISCESKNNINSIKTKQTAKTDIKKVTLNIEGMTCQIGCARTIQSKLSKNEGVEYVIVNFENKKGIVEYDSLKITKKQIISIVEKIAGGNLYKANEKYEE